MGSAAGSKARPHITMVIPFYGKTIMFTVFSTFWTEAIW